MNWGWAALELLRCNFGALTERLTIIGVSGWVRRGAWTAGVPRVRSGRLHGCGSDPGGSRPGLPSSSEGKGLTVTWRSQRRVHSAGDRGGPSRSGPPPHRRRRRKLLRSGVENVVGPFDAWVNTPRQAVEETVMSELNAERARRAIVEHTRHLAESAAAARPDATVPTTPEWT